MQPNMIDLMREEVHAIYRALTGSELSEPGSSPAGEPESTDTTIDEVQRRFVELEAIARTLPGVAAQVPPFSFTPLLDALSTDDELIFELAIPGVDGADIDVHVEGEVLVISGLRAGRGQNGRTHLHAEIPRGPFFRTVHLPFAPESAPRVHLDRGILRIHLAWTHQRPTPSKFRTGSSTETSPGTK